MRNAKLHFFKDSCAREWVIFEKAAGNPALVQDRLLRRIMRHNRETAYGKLHEFKEIKDMETFTRNVPVINAEELSPWVEKMAHGNVDILVPASPVSFNQTSGTTGKPKLVPVTRRGMQNAARASRRWLHMAIRDHPGSIGHSALLVLGAAFEGVTPGGTPFGSASGLIRGALPSVLRERSCLPERLPEINDYACYYYLLARFAFAGRISLIATPNPTTLLKIAAVADEHREPVIRGIHDGTLGDTSMQNKIPRRLLDRFRKLLVPDRVRARFLETVVGQRGALLPMDCWKELRLIGCWLGGTVGVQAAKLAPVFGKTPVRDIGYIASEGWFSIPFRSGTPAGVLDILGNVFEFIPEEEPDIPNATPLRCEELAVGKQYRMLLTNWNGLYRYDIGDIIEVLGFHLGTPLVAFVRKSGDMLNITGEKLHANHLLSALRKIQSACGPAPSVFRIAPDLAANRYQIMLAFAVEPSRGFIRKKFIPLLDKSLCKINVEYDLKRKSGRLHLPCVHIMDAEWETEVRKLSPAADKRDAQFKWKVTVPALSEIDLRHIRNTIEP